MITFDHLWNAALSLIAVVLAFLLKTESDRRRELREAISKEIAAAIAAEESRGKEALSAHKTYAAETFARRTEITAALDKIDARFDRLDESIDELKDRLPPKQG